MEAYVQARSVSLQGVIETADPTQSLVEVVGGAVIDVTQSVNSGTPLPYQTSVQATWAGDVPDQFRVAFRVQFMGLDATLYGDEIAGRRVRLATRTPGSSFVRTSKIYLDGAPVATAVATGSPFQVDRPMLSVNHPLANGITPGTHGDDSVQIALVTDVRDSNYCNGGGCNLPFFEIYSLYLDVGSAGRGREQHFARLVGDFREDMIEPEMTGLSGSPIYVNSTYDRRPNAPVMAAKHASQTAEALRLLSSLGQGRVSPFHSLGALYAQGSLTGGDNHLYYNLRSSLTSVNSTSNMTDSAATFAAAAAVSAALEGSAFQQTEDTYEAGASVSMFKLANSKGFRFYQATSSNIASILNITTNYTTARKALLQSYATQGYTVILPSNGLIGTIAMPGSNTGTITLNIAPELIFNASDQGYLLNEEYKGGGSVAQSDPAKDVLASARATSNSVRDQKYYGVDLASGALNLTPAPDLTVGSGVGALQFRRNYSSATATTGIRCNFVYDAFYAFHFDCGSTDFGSYSLIGGGWNHDANVTAAWSGSGSEGLGATSAVRAARSIAALYGLIDTNRSTTFQRRMTSLFVTYSFIDGFLRNAVTTSNSGQFVRLPDGRFDPPPSNRAARLVASGVIGSPLILPGSGSIIRDYSATQFDLYSGDGTQWTFKPAEGVSSYVNSLYVLGLNADNLPNYAATASYEPSGIRRSYNYLINLDNYSRISKKVVSGISSSTGYSLSLSYPNYSNPPPGPSNFFTAGSGGNGGFGGFGRLASVSNGLGQAVGFACNSITPEAQPPAIYWNAVSFRLDCGIDVTDTVNGLSRFGYASGNGSQTGALQPDRVLTSWYTPSNSSAPYLNVTYDRLLHVASYQDIGGRLTKTFTTTVADDRYRIGEMRDANGAITSTIFDENAMAVKSTDAVGNVTSHVYDSARRLLRTVHPEGNAVEYQYDLRGNTIRECQIPKGAVAWTTLTPLTERTAQCNPARTPAADLVTTTTYVGGPTLRPDQCVNVKTCNKPQFVIDPRGFRTNYTWDTTHGGMLTEVTGLTSAGACPLVGGVCPATAYGYTAFTGTDGATFYLMTSKTEQIDAATTTNTSFEYDPANHWVLRSVVTTSGGQALRTCFSFDAVGNPISQTEPRANLASCL